ncbi:MAG: hypothetical protein Ct9H90mP16_20530 [Candidatus Poseidoniales archaeon]|nr:MAG: hypothetical protein Ct9H90mP16_20530 [Candidatus Poseidoniales archaeon]
MTPLRGLLTVDLDSEDNTSGTLEAPGGRVGEQIVFSNGPLQRRLCQWEPDLVACRQLACPLSADVLIRNHLGFSPDLGAQLVALVPLQICKLETWTAMELKIRSFGSRAYGGKWDHFATHWMDEVEWDRFGQQLVSHLCRCR